MANQYEITYHQYNLGFNFSELEFFNEELPAEEVIPVEVIPPPTDPVVIETNPTPAASNSTADENEIKGTDKKDYLDGTSAVDVMTGGRGKDEFGFRKDSTLNDGDRITDYENEESILIGGINMRPQDVSLHYDPDKGHTELRLDFDGDGKTDNTIILDGDKRGDLDVVPSCCGNLTEIRITLDQNPTITIDTSQLASTFPIGVATNVMQMGQLFSVILGDDAGNTLTGTDAPDDIIGEGGNDTIDAGGGPDTVDGGDGNDTIIGGAGDDTLRGGDGNDVIKGDDAANNGNGIDPHDADDVLIGGKGADVLSGGVGDDTFRYPTADDIEDGETITDYEAGELIDVDGLGANQVRLTPTPGGSNLEFDFDGDGKFEKKIKLDGVDSGMDIHIDSSGIRLLEKKTGTAASETINLENGANSVFVNGGEGLDTVVVSGSGEDFGLNHTPTGLVVLEENGATEAALLNVERVNFDDGNLYLDTGAGDNAGQAYRVYQAAFARTPDDDGLKFWIDQVDEGMSLRDVSVGFINSQEFQSVYGTNPSNEDFVAKLYGNVLGREGEKAGIDFWVSEMDSGNRDQAQILSDFSESAENIAGVAPIIENGFWLGH